MTTCVVVKNKEIKDIDFTYVYKKRRSLKILIMKDYNDRTNCSSIEKDIALSLKQSYRND